MEDKTINLESYNKSANGETVKAPQSTRFCASCGSAISENQAFCANCGAPVNAAQASVAAEQTAASATAPEQAPVNRPAPSPTKPKKKKKTGLIIGLVIGGVVLFTVIGLVLLLVVGGLFAVGTIATDEESSEEETGPNFQEVYNGLSTTYGIEVAADGSYLSLDTNVYDLDDYYNSSTLAAIKEVHSALNLPDSLYQEMLNTSYSMGKQTETFPSQGVTVSWTYHPDKGLEITYKLINY